MLDERLVRWHRAQRAFYDTFSESVAAAVIKVETNDTFSFDSWAIASRGGG